MKMCRLLKDISVSMQRGEKEMTYTINQSHEIHQMKKHHLIHKEKPNKMQQCIKIF
jgi:hypothetical protein